MAVEDIDIYRLPGDPTRVSVPREYRERYNFRQGRRFCDMRVSVSPSEKNLQAVSPLIVTEQAYEFRLKAVPQVRGFVLYAATIWSLLQ